MAVETSTIPGAAMLVTAALFYFPPTIVAWLRRHPNRVSIFLLNLFLGWTGIGWLAALIWSASAIRKSSPIEHAQAVDTSVKEVNPYQRLEQLADLKERGHITAEEFEAEKAKILNS